jgi:dihydroxyacetone kinase-like predicted kinase
MESGKRAAVIDAPTLVAMISAGAERIYARVDELNRLDVWPVAVSSAGDQISSSLRQSLEHLPLEPALPQLASAAERVFLMNWRGHQSAQIIGWLHGLWVGAADYDAIAVADLPVLFRGAAANARRWEHDPPLGDVWHAARNVAQRVESDVYNGQELASVLDAVGGEATEFLNESRRVHPFLASPAGCRLPALPSVIAFAELLEGFASVGRRLR